jgi:hypothetical protein
MVYGDSMLVLQLERAPKKCTRRFKRPAIAAAMGVDECGAEALGLLQQSVEGLQVILQPAAGLVRRESTCT